MASSKSLYDYATACKSAFDEVLDVDIIETFDVPQQLQDSVSEERARFKIWAANIGALASGSASLDHRLSESQRVRMLVADQVSIVTDSMNQLLRTVRHVDENEKQSEDALFRIDSLSPQQSITSTEDDEARRIESCLERAHDAVTRLNRIAKAIRLPGMVSQISRAANYRPLDAYGNDIVQQFEDYTLELIKCYFQHADPSVRLRLARANASRRRTFLFRRKHQDFISGRRVSLPKEQQKTSRPVTQRTGSISWDSEQLQISQPRIRTPMSMDGQSMIQSSIGDATEFDENQFQPDTKSVAPGSSIASSFASAVNRSRFPPPPKVPDGRAEFECPYCMQLTNSAELEKRRWRRHVIKDLEPYVCIKTDCKDPDAKFANQADWINHMRTHAVHWKCRLPHPHGQKDNNFTTEREFEAHIWTHHRQLKDIQKTLLKRTSRATDPEVFRVCPLCFIRAEDLIPNAAVTHTRGKPDPISHTVYGLKMQKHLAAHLQFIASFSLPWLDDAYSDIASDNALSSGGTDTTRSSIADGSRSDSPTKKVADMDEDLAELTFEDFEGDAENTDSTDEWSFILQSSYDGHEHDPILEPFVRKHTVYDFFTKTEAKAGIAPCLYLPVARNPNFYGRQDILDLLKEHLLPHSDEDNGNGNMSDGLRIFSLHGTAGLGKTQVAMEFAHRYKSRFDVVLWIHVDERSKTLKDIVRIVNELGLVDGTSADAGDQAFAASLLKAWLRNSIAKLATSTKPFQASWLLVLDHVIDPKILEEFDPTDIPRGSILITGRKPVTWQGVDHPYKTLQSFTPHHGATFMCRLTGREVSEHEFYKAGLISQTVRGIPYALEHLAKWIMEENLAFSEFLTVIETQENGRLAELKARGTELAEPSGLDEHRFLESALPNMEHSTALLQVLSLMDPDKISEYMLRTEDTNLRATDYPSSKAAYQKAVTELLKYSLVTRETPTTLSIPRIVQDGVRRRMSPSRYQDIFSTCIALLYAKWPFLDFTWRHSVSRWPQCEELFPHIVRIRKFGANTYNSKDNPDSAFDYARLACDCGWYCHERVMPAEADIFSSLAQFICEEISKNFDVFNVQVQNKIQRDLLDYTLAENHYNQGCVALEINRPENALVHLSRFNAMMLKEFGDGSPGTDMRLALSFNQLGCGYMLKQDYSQAAHCYENCIANMEKLDNYERWQISLPMINLGQLYWLTGRYSEALETLKEGRKERAKKFGQNDRESFITGRFLYSLGNVYWSLREFDDSLHYHHQALSHYRDTLGSGHHRTADTLIRLTAHYLRLSRHTEALELVDKAIRAYESNSVWKTEVIRAKFWRFRVLQKLDLKAEATKEATEFMTKYREVRPEDLRPIEALKDEDLDVLVGFWSR